MVLVIGTHASQTWRRTEPDEDESYYSDEECEDDVKPEVAAKVAGQIGNVLLHESLSSRCVSKDLKGKYENGMEQTAGVGTWTDVGVREMLCALVRDGALLPRGGGGGGKEP